MRRLLVLLAVVALLGGACSGSDDDASVDDASVDAAATDDAGSSSEPAPESDPETGTEPEPEPTTEPVPDPEQDVPSFDFSAVDPLIETFVEDNGLNGAALVMVHRDFGIVDERFWGVFDADRVSLLASSSKMVTAGVLLALDDAGQLDIDAPIADVLPFASDHPEITTAQLLSNSSGLPGLLATAEYPDYLCVFFHTGTLQDCAERILTTPADDAAVVSPDTAFDYGGAQWQVAGAVAEVASGQSWAELVDQLFVQPCGLDVFAFTNPFSQVEGAGFSHPPGFDNNPEIFVATDNPNLEGGAYSNSTDYAELMLMHLRGGRCGDQQVLSPAALASMHGDRIGAVYGGDANGSDTGYGMGWWVSREDGTITDPGAFGAVPWLNLEDGYGALLLTESSSALAVPFSRSLGPLVDEAFAAALG